MNLRSRRHDRCCLLQPSRLWFLMHVNINNSTPPTVTTLGPCCLLVSKLQFSIKLHILFLQCCLLVGRQGPLTINTSLVRSRLDPNTGF